jgi:hypothetical protein
MDGASMAAEQALACDKGFAQADEAQALLKQLQ